MKNNEPTAGGYDVEQVFNPRERNYFIWALVLAAVGGTWPIIATGLDGRPEMALLIFGSMMLSGYGVRVIMPLSRFSVSVNSRQVCGPVRRGLFFKRRNMPIEDIDYEASQIRHWNASFLIFNDGTKMILSSTFLGWAQVHAIMSTLRNSKPAKIRPAR